MSREISLKNEQKNSSDNLISGSEDNKEEKIEIHSQQNGKDLISDDGKSSHGNSSLFKIDVMELEGLMGKYKERGADFQDLKYFEKKSVSELVAELQTDTEKGVADLTGREEAFGSNKVFKEKVPHFCHYVWEALKDLMVRILIVAAIVSIILGCTFSDDPSKDWVDGVSIVVAVLIVVLVSSITDYQK